MLRLYNFEKSNYVNGTGKRFVIWFQGCNLGCKECWNKDSWSMDKGFDIDENELFTLIKNEENLDGVTFTGGEPFLQFDSLKKIITFIKENSSLTVHIFTGYDLEELDKLGYSDLLPFVDTIVTGRFDSSKKDNNQQVHHLTGNDNWIFDNSNVEIEIELNGDITVTGYPKNDLLNSLMEKR